MGEEITNHEQTITLEDKHERSTRVLEVIAAMSHAAAGKLEKKEQLKDCLEFTSQLSHAISARARNGDLPPLNIQIPDPISPFVRSQLVDGSVEKITKTPDSPDIVSVIYEPTIIPKIYLATIQKSDHSSTSRLTGSTESTL